MHTVQVELGDRAYPVHVGAQLLPQLPSLVAGLGAVPRVVVVSDSNVAPLYLGAVVAGLKSVIGIVDEAVIPAGETSKNVDVLTRLWDVVLDGGADRKVVVVALGGGVVGDIAGFAAATALRGVRVVQVPTSLLAQVDSSVGGKAAINRSQGKNLVGAFKQPELVVADVSTLATLPPRELRAGLAEAVKHGAILDADLLNLINARAPELLDAAASATIPVVARCCELKASVVAADEREAGYRRVLNFGHTVGHAIEKLAGYGTVLHGEAVAIGMVAAAEVAQALGLADDGPGRAIRAALDALGLPKSIPAAHAPDALIDAIAHDKKVDASSIGFVVCPAIGTSRVIDLPLRRLHEILGAIHASS